MDPLPHWTPQEFQQCLVKEKRLGLSPGSMGGNKGSYFFVSVFIPSLLHLYLDFADNAQLPSHGIFNPSLFSRLLHPRCHSNRSWECSRPFSHFFRRLI